LSSCASRVLWWWRVACYNRRVTGIDQFEALVQQLVEGTFGRLFPPPEPFSVLVHELGRAMDAGRRTVAGQVVVPARYRIALHPADYAALQRRLGDRLDEEMVECLQRLATAMEVRLTAPPMARCVPDPALPPGRVEVRECREAPTSADLPHTRELPVAADQTAEAGQWTLRLGHCTYRLGEPVISVGRALSNDIILDDRRVSRRHARLRWHDGRYYLSDTDSREGVSVNGRLVQPGLEWPLDDGDRIGLAGLELVLERDGSASDEGVE